MESSMRHHISGSGRVGCLNRVSCVNSRPNLLIILLEWSTDIHCNFITGKQFCSRKTRSEKSLRKSKKTGEFWRVNSVTDNLLPRPGFSLLLIACYFCTRLCLRLILSLLSPSAFSGPSGSFFLAKKASRMDVDIFLCGKSGRKR